MTTFTFVLCILSLLTSRVTNELQSNRAQEFFLFGTTSTTTTTTTTNTTSPTSMPVSTQPTTASANDSIGMETENNITLGSSTFSCSQIVNITGNNTALHFRIPQRNSIHCVITIQGQTGQYLSLKLQNITIQPGMLDCEQGSVQLYTLKQGLLYFRNKTCDSAQSLSQLTTENNIAVLSVTVSNSTKEQGFELEVTTMQTEGYSYPNSYYGHSGTSFGLPSITYIPGATYEPPSITYTPPGATYKVPSGSYGQPSYTYRPPNTTYGPPNVTYRPPSVIYGSLTDTYGPPTRTYGLPDTTYGPPSGTYGPPPGTYGPPIATYGPPTGTYGPPIATYGPPTGTYGPPIATYGPPTGTYGPPNTTYGPPSATYGPPSATYGPPSATYGPPSGTYELPPGYGPGAQYNGSNSGGTHSGFLNYIIAENQNPINSVDRHYNPTGDYGYGSNTPPEYNQNKNNYNSNPNLQDGYSYRCEHDCNSKPWKVTTSAFQQGDSYYNPYSSQLYAWLTSGTKPKNWSNELH